MKNLIKTLKSTTLGDAIAPIKNRSMLDVVLDLTGLLGNLHLAIALLAKLDGDSETADYSLAGGFVCLLAKALLANFAEMMEADEEAAKAADDAADANAAPALNADDSVEISLDDFGEA